MRRRECRGQEYAEGESTVDRWHPDHYRDAETGGMVCRRCGAREEDDVDTEEEEP